MPEGKSRILIAVSARQPPSKWRRGRALSLLAGVALLGVIARLIGTTPFAQASLLAAAEAARETAQSLLQSAVAFYRDKTHKMADVAMQAPPRASEGGDLREAALPLRVAARTADAPPDASPGNPLWLLPVEQLSITRERPIFSPSRRPPPPEPTYVAPVAIREPVKPPPQPESPPISLLGTIIGAGDQIGVFLETATQKVIRLRIGEAYQGWVLRLIETREVTLVKEGEQAAVLELPTTGKTPALSDQIAAPPGPGDLRGVAIATIPILSNETSSDEQPVRPARGARRQGR